MKFAEFVDIEEFRGLCESYTATTGAVTALLELDGTILIATGWQDICTRFHRVNEATCRRCRESDTILAGGLGKGEPYNIYKCKNGLVDVAVPIMIRGEHVANFFTGQFLTEAPDRDYFLRQAEEFGFDKNSYLEALHRVPIFSEEAIKSMMGFFTRLAQMMGEIGLARMELEEGNQELRMFKESVENSTDAVGMATQEGKHVYQNRAFSELFGAIGENPADVYVDKTVATEMFTTISAGQPWTGEVKMYAKDKRVVDISLRVYANTNADGKIVGLVGIHTDVTERKRAEEELRKSQIQLAHAMELAHLTEWEFDALTGTFTFNDRFYALYGTTAEREGGYQMSAEVYAREFVYPDDQHFVAVEVERALNATDPAFISQAEHRIVRRDGEVRHIVVRFGITKDANGRTVRTNGANQDITELKRVEELQEALLEILEASLASESIEALSKRIHMAVNRLMDARNLFLSVYDGETESYTFPYFADERDSGTMDLSKPIKLGQGFTEYVRRSKKSLLINKALVQDLVDRGEVEMVGSRSESWMGVPLFDGEEVMGVLVVQSYSDPDAYSEEDLSILTFVSGPISLVLKDVQAEEALRKSEYFFRESQQAAVIGSYRLDFVNGVWVSSEVLDFIFGIDKTYSRTVAGWLDIVHPDELEIMNRYLQDDVIGARKPFDHEYRIVRKADGETRWVHGRGTVSFDEHGNVVSMIGTVQDITERKRAEEEVKDSRDRLRELTARLDEVREDERTILARELHDEVGQNLTAMRMELSMIEKEIPAGWERVSDSLHSMIAITQDSVDRVNRLAKELRSPILDMLGLADAVESELWDFEKRWGTETSLEMEMGELEAFPDRDLTIFKILKESLSNVRRHAQAGRVEVSLRVVGRDLVLEVLDNGIGITVDQLRGHKSFGLLGMRERAGRLGGEFEVQRRDEGGTRVRASVPLSPENG